VTREETYEYLVYLTENDDLAEHFATKFYGDEAETHARFRDTVMTLLQESNIGYLELYNLTRISLV
jgi:hypothetical protein